MNLSLYRSMSTIVLKLYKPSSRKKEIIDEAMLNYSRAFQFLLDRAEIQIDLIKDKYIDNNGKYRTSYLTKWIDKELDRELNKFSIEPFKDSIKIDFAATLSGYLNLKQKGSSINYPSVYITNEELEQEYERSMIEYTESNKSSDILEDKIEKLIIKSNKSRTLFFCRYSTNRNYCLLYNKEKDRYYAKIYLMNVKNEKRKKLTPYKGNVLIYIDKKKEVFNESLSKKCFILFPLAFGKWQEKFLKKAIQNPEIIKTARLTKRKNEYFLSINIIEERPGTMETVNYLGISRGIDNILNYAIVDNTGNVISTGCEKSEDGNVEANKIHEMANFFVKIAKENMCQVIMERLVDRGDGLVWKDKDGKSYFPILDMHKYNQLCDILNYKLPNNGLPTIIKVSGINIFYSCPNCGINSKENRFSSEILICTSCGRTIDIEIAGSLNLARKLIKYKNTKIKIKAENTENGLKFINKDLEFEYYPDNPYDCLDEFKEKINVLIKDFYDNISIEYKKVNFKKKLGFIKKLEGCKSILELIEID